MSRRRANMTAGDKYYVEQNLDKEMADVSKFLNVDQKVVEALAVELRAKPKAPAFQTVKGTVSQTEQSSLVGDSTPTESKGNFQQDRYKDVIYRPRG